MSSTIRAIARHLPSGKVTNDDLTAAFPQWTADQIRAKTGISERRVAAQGECASDLAFQAAENLFASGRCTREDIDHLLFCTQSPDFLLPSTACILQARLQLRTDVGAFDINLGCSGYVYGLSVAKGLIESGQGSHILLLCADTYSKYINPADRNVISIFGDAGTATLISRGDTELSEIGPFVVGTDGKGAEQLIVHEGACRSISGTPALDSPRPRLFMDGPEIFTFTMRSVPALVRSLLEKAGCKLEDIGLFVFHQANEYMLEHLRKKIGIPKEKFLVAMEYWGNTVSASIPLALHDAGLKGRLSSGDWTMLVGFGVGYSWGAALVRVGSGAAVGDEPS